MNDLPWSAASFSQWRSQCISVVANGPTGYSHYHAGFSGFQNLDSEILLQIISVWPQRIHHQTTRPEKAAVKVCFRCTISTGCFRLFLVLILTMKSMRQASSATAVYLPACLPSSTYASMDLSRHRHTQLTAQTKWLGDRLGLNAPLTP